MRLRTLALISRQHLPSSHDHIVEDLEGNVWIAVSQPYTGGPRVGGPTFRLGIGCFLEDVANGDPGIGILLELETGFSERCLVA